MSRCRFISAVGTPLLTDESLDSRALADHLDDQWKNGIDGILVGGTMGLMQLLRDTTYEQLIDIATAQSVGCGELLVGVGDTSFVRTLDRIQLACRYPIDGVVVLCPYFVKFSQAELTTYYQRLADFAAVPIFIYHLPALTGVELEHATVIQLAAHPNIHGIKCSCKVEWTRALRDLVDEEFRIIFAQPSLVNTLCESGYCEHLDGIFSAAPAWVVAIGRAVEQGDLATAGIYQSRLNELLRVVHQYGVFPAFTTILNARGIGGNYAPAPMQPLDRQTQQKLLSETILSQLISDHATTRASQMTS